MSEEVRRPPDGHATDDPALPPVPPPPAGTDDLIRRAGARLLDGLLVGVILGLTFFATGRPLDSPVYLVVPPLVNLAYFVFFEAAHGATPGKLAVGLRVRSTAGRDVTASQAFARNWWLVFSLVADVGLFILAGITIYIALTINSDERNQGFHDRMAKTLVVPR